MAVYVTQSPTIPQTFIWTKTGIVSNKTKDFCINYTKICELEEFYYSCRRSTPKDTKSEDWG